MEQSTAGPFEVVDAAAADRSAGPVPADETGRQEEVHRVDEAGMATFRKQIQTKAGQVSVYDIVGDGTAGLGTITVRARVDGATLRLQAARRAPGHRHAAGQRLQLR